MKITLISDPDGGLIYASPSMWNHPPTALAQDQSNWVLVETVEDLSCLKKRAGDLYPRYPGDWSVIDVPLDEILPLLQRMSSF